MVEITEQELRQFEALKKVWIHLRAEHTGAFFICGEAGDKDDMGLPEYIEICPMHGLDGSVIYKRYTDYSAPGW
jgi:hypothetical protein